MTTVPASERLVVSLDDAVDGTVAEIGLKGWYLSRLRDLGFNTPEGFVVTAAAYESAMRNANVEHRLDAIWAAARNASGDDIAMLARKARHLISQVHFDGTLTHAIDASLAALVASADVDAAHVPPMAVRSSTAPGTVSGPECAGVHASFTDVVGSAHVVSRIHSCWASLFGERALAMRARGLGADDPTMAVVVQRMVHAQKSGLATPRGASSDLLVEATFGLGEPIISGAVEPDRYVIDRAMSSPTSATIGRKLIVLESGGGHAFLPPERQVARVLDDADLARIGRLSASIDEHFGAPHEIEWAILDDTLHVLQIRPFTPGPAPIAAPVDRSISGIGIGVGFATGRVRIARRLADLANLRAGEVVVASDTTPEWTPHLEHAGAVITDHGDGSCHAARLARELGIPAVVGTGTATSVLADGHAVTVDAARGWVLPAVALDRN